MNEREENKELIRRIAETLRNHAEPYQEGAWERFATAYAKPVKRGVWWPYWGAAAALLLTVGVLWSTHQPTDPKRAQSDIVRHEAGSQQGVRKEPQPSAPVQNEVPIRTTVHKETRAPIAENEQLLVAVIHTANDSGTGTALDTTAQDGIANGGAPGVADTAAERKVDAISERLATVAEQGAAGLPVDAFPTSGPVDQGSENPIYAVTANKPQSPLGKWDLGLVVSPSLTSEQVNMGGGIAVAYRLSDKFSLGSGVSIGQLGVGQNPNYDPRVSMSDMQSSPSPNTGSNGFMASAKAYREETSITSSVVTLDIPFDLRYDVAKGFYTSVGVSYVTVLSEQRTSHFVTRLNERTLGNNHATDKDLAAAVEAVFSEEKIAAQPLKGKGYTGFVNFSIGRKVPLSSKLSIAVEPYFKLPIGRLSRADMDFTNGGIRIVTGF